MDGGGRAACTPGPSWGLSSARGPLHAWLPLLCRACANERARVQAQGICQADLGDSNTSLITVPGAKPTLWRGLKNIFNVCIQIGSCCPFSHTAREVI